MASEGASPRGCKTSPQSRLATVDLRSCHTHTEQHLKDLLTVSSLLWVTCGDKTHRHEVPTNGWSWLRRDDDKHHLLLQDGRLTGAEREVAEGTAPRASTVARRASAVGPSGLPPLLRHLAHLRQLPAKGCHGATDSVSGI